MHQTFRPIDAWPGEMTSYHKRKRSPFDAPYEATLDLLDRELRNLRARDVVIQLALGESDIRNDGLPRAASRPEHPGVILAFDSIHGPLKYSTDVFTHWQANLRAIALGLEALRRVERYGITKRGEQYTGWRAIGSGAPIAVGEAPMTVEAAARWIAMLADWSGPDMPDSLITNPDVRAAAYRDAAKRHHPDAGGDPEDFRKLSEAKAVLDCAS